jgi:hypothetical protein
MKQALNLVHEIAAQTESQHRTEHPDKCFQSLTWKAKELWHPHLEVT